MRRSLAHAFSDKALRSQESIIQSHIDLLIHQFSEQATKGKAVNMTTWYNFLTFDIICDLSFGEPLYCLRDNNEHSWISLVHGLTREGSIKAVYYKSRFFEYYDKLVKSLSTDTLAQEAGIEFSQRTAEKVGTRLEKGTEARSRIRIKSPKL
jgi:cytochrome P450